jgi:ribosomal-protein-serine acetyltransferase
VFFWTVDDEVQLKLLLPWDASELARLVDDNREHLGRWLPWVTPTYGIVEAEGFIVRNLENIANGRGLYVAICERRQPVGMVGVENLEWELGRATLGYWLDRQHCGRGLATRAAAALVTFLLEQWGFRRLEIHTAAGNRPSQRVAERLGFHHEATLSRAIWSSHGVQDRQIWVRLAEGGPVPRVPGYWRQVTV